MKIAFTSKGTNWDSLIDPRFGRTEYLLFYDEKSEELSFMDNRDIAQEARGAGPLTAEKLFKYKPDVLITGNGPGQNASVVLDKINIEIYVGASEMTVREAYETYKNNNLKKI